jgi:hypothetical protein
MNVSLAVVDALAVVLAAATVVLAGLAIRDIRSTWGASPGTREHAMWPR